MNAGAAAEAHINYNANDLPKLTLTRCRVFVEDTETSGCYGMPPAHEEHVLLQLYSKEVNTGEVYQGYVSHGKDFRIPRTSSSARAIGDAVLQELGKGVDVAFMDYVEFTDKHCNWSEETNTYEFTPVKVFHNAAFDKVMIQKHLPRAFLERVSQWVFVCNLSAMRSYYPDIARNGDKPLYRSAPYWGQPYKLQSLMRHFYPTLEGQFHTAEFDVTCLELLFREKILPRLQEGWEGGEKEMFQKFEVRGPFEFDRVPQATLVKKIKFAKKYLKPLVAKLNNAFLTLGCHQKLTNENLVCCGHILEYGYLWTMNLMRRQGSGGGGRDAWHATLSMIETVMRQDFKVYSDEVILELFTFLTATDAVTLVQHAKREDGVTPLFPTMPGRPVSYLPFKLSDESARVVYECFRYRTVHDMYVGYLAEKDPNQKQWFYRLLNKLPRHEHDQFAQDNCLKVFNMIAPSKQYLGPAEGAPLSSF